MKQKIKFSLIVLILFLTQSCKKELSNFEKEELIIQQKKEEKIDSLKSVAYSYKDRPLLHISKLKEILKIDYNNQHALGDIGVIYYNINEYSNAIKYLSKAIKNLNNNNETYLLNHFYLLRGKSKFALNDFRGAISDLNNCKKTYNDNREYNQTLAHSYLNIRDKSNACKYFRIAGELGYSDAYAIIEKNCN